MYHCNSCDTTFKNPLSKIICLEDEYGLEYTDHKHTQRILVCPECESSEIKEIDVFDDELD